MDDPAQAAQTIAKFLQAFTSSGGLRLRFRVKARSIRQRNTDSGESPDGSRAESTAAEDAGKDGPRALYVEFTGPDTPVLTARNGELLNALEHIATKMLRLEPHEQDRVSFDADQFKANRDRQMQESASAAIQRVRNTGEPHAFPPMNSRERRMLHMLLSESGLPTASSGEGPGRFVVLYPKGADTSAPYNYYAADATQSPPRRPDINQVRNAFRPRF
jgi:spoIIIJ-associated protein